MARSSHPSNARTEEEIKSDHHLLTDACCISLKLLVCLHTGKDTIHKIAEQNQGKRRCMQDVTNTLKMQQKQEQTA